MNAADDALAPPDLEPFLDIDAQVSPPVIVGQSILGTRRVIPIDGGTVRGAIEGVVLPGGADFQLIRPDGVAEIEARYVIQSNEGELVYVTNVGRRHAPPDVLPSLLAGDLVDPAKVYFRTAPRFETASERLAFLNDDLFVATGARFPDRVALRFFRLR